jgi:hypothetical protein
MTIEPGLYQHFKGGRVRVLGTATHSEAHHMKLVVYHDVENPEQLWARPLEMFVQYIRRGAYDGLRFWPIKEDGTPIARPELERKPEPTRPAHDASRVGQRQS